MIDTLQRIASRLGFLKPVFVIIGIAALVCAIAELFYSIIPGEEDALLVPSIVVFLWSIIGATVLNTFSAVPGDTSRKLAFFKRLALRFKRAVYYGLAILFGALTIAALFMTYKLFSIWA